MSLPSPSASQRTTVSAQGLHGKCRVPSDKSISHRSLMFAGLCPGTSELRHVLPSADVLSTAGILEALGVSLVSQQTETGLSLTVTGGLPWKEPSTILDCGNSGTTMRLMSGLLAGQGLYCVLSGDKSLNSRPMKRVIAPLNTMGAQLTGREGNTKAPLCIQPVKQLHGIDYTLPMASAQVKSALLLAGLFASGTTRITEPLATRDHTERFFKALGIRLNQPQQGVWELPGQQIEAIKEPLQVAVPGDPSSAAFPMVAALLSPGSELLLQEVCLNPTRTGLIQALRQLGACITVQNERQEGGEPVGDLLIKASELKGHLHLKAADIPALVDEIPVLMVAALFVQGSVLVEGAEELRAKESDRLDAMASELAKLGITIDMRPDGFYLEGQPERTLPMQPNAPLATWHDHRIAMALATLNLIVQQRNGHCWQADKAWPMNDNAIVNVSFPGFFELLERLQCV